MTELTGMDLQCRLCGSGRQRVGRRAICAVALSAAFLIAQITGAHAHLVTTGLGPFYDGFVHVLFAPEDALAIFALALLSGMSGILGGRAVLFTLPAAWCIGALVGLHAPAAQSTSMPWLTIATFLGLGILIAVNCRLSALAMAGLSITLGLAHGYFNGAVMTATNFVFSMLAGTLVSMFFVIAVVAAVVVSLRAPWTRIAVQTLGSWIAAGGLLLLGWIVREALT
jgi:hydrogenase/urease accessory protein HupE